MSDTENTRILPVQMTPEECATKALQLATVCQDIASAERDAKDVAAEAKERIKALEKDRDGLAGCVRTGKEYRTVDVYKRMNLSLRTWEIRRTDTLEIVESKAMTEWEYRDATQVKLPFSGGQRVENVPPAAQDPFVDLDQKPTRLTTALAEADKAIDEAVDGILARQRAQLAKDQGAPGGQEIPAPKPPAPLTATVGEIAGDPEPCVNPNCRAPITNKAQARAGRCGACAKFFRVKGVERHAGPRVVDKSQPTP